MDSCKILRIFVLILILSLSTVHSQPNIDSLQNLLRTAKTDTNKVNLFNAICNEYYQVDDFEKLFTNSENAVNLASELSFDKGLAYAHFYHANALMGQEKNEKAVQHFNTANELFTSLSIVKYSGISLSRIAEIYDRSSVFDKAIDYYFQSLKKYDAINFTNGILFNYNRLGIIYSELGNFSKAIEMYEQCLKIDEQRNDEVGIANDYNDLGSAYKNKGELNKAYEYHQKALEIRKKLERNLEIGESLGNIANVFLEQGNFKKSLDYHKLASEVFIKTKTEWRIAQSYNNIADVQIKLGNCNEAVNYGKKSVELSEKTGSKSNIKKAYKTLAEAYHCIGDAGNAYEYFRLYSNMKDSLISEESTKRVAEMQTLYETEKKEKEIELLNKDKKIASSEIKRQKVIIYSSVVGALLLIAFLVFYIRAFIRKKRDNVIITQQKDELAKLSIVASETDNSVFIMDSEGNIEWANAGFTRLLGYTLQEYIDKNGKNLLLASGHFEIKSIFKNVRDTKKSIQYEALNETKSGNKIWMQTTLTPIANENGAIAKIVAIDSNISELKNAEHEIKRKTKEITDSINYALRIQKAVLPHRSDIWRALPESFVLYKPKDIVAGDFYWFHKNQETILIAAADCTGHGVPGAFTSMICSEKLNDAVKYSTNPSEILSFVNKGIKVSLRQAESKDATKDGMDIALCSVDLKSGIVKFTGANRPFFLIRNGQTEIEEIKATKKAIGGFTEDNQVFETHAIQMKPKDTFYIFSDGYADQNGGDEDKKLMTKKFKQILIDIQDKSMKEQGNYLDEFIKRWMGTTEQRDDILVNNTVTASSTGSFTYSFATDTSMTEGIYHVQGTDSVSGKTTTIKSFQLINNTTPTTRYLQIIYPTQNLTFYTNDSINVEWQDKMILGNNYTVSGSKRNYKYTLEYSANGGAYQNIGTVQGQAYINTTVNLNKKFKLSSASSNVVVRVSDFYEATNFKISPAFDIIQPSVGNAQVALKWDYSFPDPVVPCLGVAADGVSRIYLQLTSSAGTMSNVSVTLNDGINSNPTKLGKVMVATNSTSYSSEANAGTTATATDNTSKPTYNFWYVSPDDFAGNNPADTSSSYRIVNAEFSVNYQGGGTETVTKKIQIVRPPLMLVHGLGGDPSSFDNFSTSYFGRFINDYRFLIKRAVKMNPIASFQQNAVNILVVGAMNPQDPNFYNTFQGLIYDLRKQGYASNKVDYVGHSMGGCILRSVLDNYYTLFTRTGIHSNKDYKNYESGYVHKFISIGTPHNSSPWADVVNRYVGSLPCGARTAIQAWFAYSSKETILPLNFIKAKNVGGGSLCTIDIPIYGVNVPVVFSYPWEYEPTPAVMNLQIDQSNGGINFNSANVKAHLIAGDFFPGTQTSLPSIIPQTAINYIQNVGNESLEKFLNYLLEVASKKETDPILKNYFINLVSSNVDGISKSLDFLDKATIAMDAVNMVTFLPESDLIVHISSQLADFPKSVPNDNSNVSVFDNWVAHTIIRKELDNVDIGNWVHHLLNAPINSTLFGSIPATSNKVGNNPLPPLASDPIIDKVDTTMLNLISPDNGTIVNVDSTINILIDVKDTTNLRVLKLHFQNKIYPVNNFQMGLNNLNLQVNNQMLDTQLIFLEGFYLYADSAVYVRDGIAVIVTTTSPLVSFEVNPDILYLVTGEATQIQHIGIYQDFVAAVSNFHPNISVTVNNSSVVQFDTQTKLFNGISEGETYAVINFQGFSDTVYFVVFDMYIDSTLIGIDEPEISVTTKNEKSILIYPNPFSTSATAVINETDRQAASDTWNLTIFDLMGKEVKRMQSQSPKFIIDRDGLPTGMYFYNVTGKTGMVGSGKLIVAE